MACMFQWSNTFLKESSYGPNPEKYEVSPLGFWALTFSFLWFQTGVVGTYHCTRMTLYILEYRLKNSELRNKWEETEINTHLPWSLVVSVSSCLYQSTNRRNSQAIIVQNSTRNCVLFRNLGWCTTMAKSYNLKAEKWTLRTINAYLFS